MALSITQDEMRSELSLLWAKQGVNVLMSKVLIPAPRSYIFTFYLLKLLVC